ncbi:MAG TPA: hypothetical protein PKM63_04990 [Panacibacter sp.]|nr:hypothetical protein [Panacibacter sp.]HNP43616.1 hypothetical protein [Panacibacter sp.]
MICRKQGGVLLVMLLLFLGLKSVGQTKWPKVVPFKTGGKATVYQPQPDNFEGNKITGRSAISVNETAKSDAVFGAIFFEAYISTDKDSRTASIDSITITNAKFNGMKDGDQEKVDKLVALLQVEVPKWEMDISLDDLVATIRKDHSNAEIYNNDPPKIIYTTRPTTLVIIDGDPKIQKDKDLDADRVVNTPALIFKEADQWNMYNGGIWYKSTTVTDGWTEEKTMSKKVKSINDQIKKQEKENNDGKEPTEKPVATAIVVSTAPAEIIQSKGEATYKAIDGTSLSFVSNSTDNIFKDKNSSLIYILISGRWYKSSSLNGPWTYNEPDKLPADFSNIPPGSDKDEVLASVAGTDEAEEAMIDAEIPQTAKVDRKTATVKVEYDGDPKFSQIDGTTLQLAENSNLTILKDAGGKYFALDNGVWFTGSSAKGPWAVATERPRDVENIPAKSAAYSAKFVYIYQVTPEYTIQGYTAGYLGAYIQGDPVVVFGTGFYYRPWYGSIYYPRPCTWGFGFSYNPWTGWSISYGFNVGFMHIGFHFGGGYGYGYGGGWWGPPMYRPPYYRPHYGGGGYYGRPGGNHYGNNNITINNNININSNNRNNLYNNKQGVTTKNKVNNGNVSSKINNNNRPGNNNKGGIGNNNNKPGINNNNKPVAKPADTKNNVFADKDGNVFQRDDKGNINQRDNKSKDWKPTNNKQPAPDNRMPNTKPGQKPPAGTINRDMQMRDKGNNRTNNFNQAQKPVQKPAARPAPKPAARPAGGVKKR